MWTILSITLDTGRNLFQAQLAITLNMTYDFLQIASDYIHRHTVYAYGVMFLLQITFKP